MLESQGLVLQPWTAVGGPPPDRSPRRAPPGQTRTVLDGVTGRYLGFARWHAVAPGRWFRWRTRARVEVHETEDASLLCTAHRQWGLSRRWKVYDADGNRVGTFGWGTLHLAPEVARRWNLPDPAGGRKSKLQGMLIQDSSGRFLGWIAGPRESAKRLLALDGRELGSLTPAGENAVVRFDSALDRNPFVKMVFLAAFLCYDKVAPDKQEKGR